MSHATKLYSEIHFIMLIIDMEKLLNSDWLRLVAVFR